MPESKMELTFSMSRNTLGNNNLQPKDTGFKYCHLAKVKKNMSTHLKGRK
jgi:hypothetical protein